ncbi:MAG: DUF1963 domain-containing protein [Pseudoruegeria sp.]
MKNFMRNFLDGMRVETHNELDQFTRPASSLEVGNFRPSNAPNSSYIGDVKLQKRGDIWPEFHGKPLWPLAQLNLTTAPFRPNGLQDIEMITIFVSEYFMEMAGNVVNSHEYAPVGGWYLRAYPRMSDLEDFIAPEHDSPIKATEARWRKYALGDHPTLAISGQSITDQSREDPIEEIEFDSVQGTKLGGWPNCLQSPPWWEQQQSDFEYVLQLDSMPEAEWIWGEGGTAFIARSKKDPDRWALDYQFSGR